MSQDIIKATERLVMPILQDLNAELVDVVFEKEGKNWFLRVFIDKENGIDIEECGIVSERLSEKLDEEDPIEFAYFLDVSSPGAERPLKKREDFEKYVGDYIYMKLYEPVEGEKEFEGTLRSFSSDIAEVEIRIKTRRKTLHVPYEKVAKAHLAVTFN